MADDSRDDADNEITRIVRRPGPANLPVNVLRPASPSPPSATVVHPDAGVAMPPPSVPAANDSAPPVAPPGVLDRARPILTPPPPRPFAPPMGGAPLPPVPPNVNAPAPAPVVLRPAPPVPPETRFVSMPSPTPAPAPMPTPAPAPAPAAMPFAGRIAPAPLPSEPTPMAPSPVVTPTPAPAPVAAAPIPAAVWAEEPKAATPSTPAAAAGAPVAAAPVAPFEAPKPAEIDPVVGWLVVVKGPGRGVAREVVSGRNGIGSGAGQAIRLDFGDPAIAQQGHAYVVYDDEAREFFAEDGKQKIVVRLNGKLLTETMPIGHGDELRIGATTLRFVALCGPDFDWGDKEKPEEDEKEKEKAVEVAPPMVDLAPPVEVVEAVAEEAKVDVTVPEEKAEKKLHPWDE